MFRIKFDSYQKEKIKQTLKIEENANYHIVLTSSVEQIEENKVNIVFRFDQLDVLAQWLQSYKKATGTVLPGKTSRGSVQLPIDRIVTIESFGNDVFAFTDKDEIELEAKLYQLEEDLFTEGFFRISKSVIVNVAKIESIASGFNGKLILYLDNQKKTEVNRSYTKVFRQYLLKGKED